MRGWLQVRLGATWLGLPADEVGAVVPWPADLTAVPGAPGWVLGVAWFDGRIHTVLDPAAAWGLGLDAGDGRVLVRLTDDDPLGLVVAEVRGMVARRDAVVAVEGAPSALAARCEGMVRDRGEPVWLLREAMLGDWLGTLRP